ncbi:SH2 domain-containing adapter protein B isoform X1 [Hydra vulgaris]|uniref:SH2 domain-containing adapter protein B isoform X1 n=1 Tax=Hydra vulgaris TaxID=6087 RepID=UPI001F5F623F|nr:SH2 domain-containing adapter protein B isoform X2 [Hydra vulgaris]
MAGNLGKLFRFGGKKPSKKPATDSASGNLSDEDDGYVDPTESCSTQPPGLTGTRQMIPNYPPPRPGSSSSPLTGKKLQIKKDEYQDPWDSKEMSNNDKSSKLNDTYEDPFDAMKSENDLQTSKTLKTSKSTDNENDSKTLPSDTYIDPWDTFSGKNKKDLENKQNSVPTKKKDDYSDPWDSKKCTSKSYDEFDDTYSEPYDKNKHTVMDSTPHASESDVEEHAELYDMPYEERVILGVEPKINGNLKNPAPHLQPVPPQHAPYSSAKPKPSSSILPTAGEYDAPWEWKMKDVEADFEKRFSVGVESASSIKPPLNSSHPNKKPVPAVRNQSITSINTAVVANPVQKPARSNKDVSVSKAEDLSRKEYEVDPTIPLKNQGNKGETMHLKISCQNGKYILGMNSKPYDTIPEMIHYYSMNKLNIRGAEHVKLIYPVLQEAVYFTVEPGS